MEHHDPLFLWARQQSCASAILTRLNLRELPAAPFHHRSQASSGEDDTTAQQVGRTSLACTGWVFRGRDKHNDSGSRSVQVLHAKVTRLPKPAPPRKADSGPSDISTNHHHRLRSPSNFAVGGVCLTPELLSHVDVVLDRSDRVSRISIGGLHYLPTYWSQMVEYPLHLGFEQGKRSSM